MLFTHGQVWHCRCERGTKQLDDRLVWKSTKRRFKIGAHFQAPGHFAYGHRATMRWRHGDARVLYGMAADCGQPAGARRTGLKMKQSPPSTVVIERSGGGCQAFTWLVWSPSKEVRVRASRAGQLMRHWLQGRN